MMFRKATIVDFLYEFHQNLPTIELIEQALADQASGTPIAEYKPFSMISALDRKLLPADLEDAYPLTRLQIGMFYHNERNPASAMFHDIHTFRIRCPFHRESLQAALDGFVARHAALRTGFDLGSFTEPLQLVHRFARVSTQVQDLGDLELPAQADALETWIATEKRRPFDPVSPPLLRICVHRWSEAEFQLNLSSHRTILDNWSRAVMLSEILQDYAALIKRIDPIERRPGQSCYAYVAAERAALGSEDSRQFWSKKMNEPEIHVLPRRPENMLAKSEERDYIREVNIPADVLRGLDKLARTAKVPLKSVLLAAHHRVMRVLHGRSDVISGLITNGRPEVIAGMRMVGLFLNTVPLRLSMKGGTWIELVRETYRTECELIPHRRFPLAEIQKGTQGEALFETAFDFVQSHDYRSLQGCREMDIREQNGFEANSFVLFTTFILDVIEHKLNIRIAYDSAELCASQIDAICGYYVTTLAEMARQPGSRYELFSPLDVAERKQIIVDWNSNQRTYPIEAGLHTLFETQVKHTPDAVALIDGYERLSYTQLNDKANRLAHRLMDLGVKPDVLVGLCAERSSKMVVAMLAILKAGGAYVPLDPEYPHQWLATVLEDTQAPLLLTQKSLHARLPAHAAQILYLDDQNDTGDDPMEFANPESGVTRNNLAYVIYTSGSTGKPKGVAIEHRSPAALVHWALDLFSPAELAGVLASTSICFDLSVFEVFVTLSSGGTVILAENALALPTLPAAHQVTMINSVPSAMKELLRLQGVPASVRVVNLAGEPLTTALVQQIYELPQIDKVYDLYGPSETTTYSTVALRIADGPYTIGRPLTNEQIYLVDENQQPVPVGVAGEILIGGAGLARGYLNQPELTAEKFIPHPFDTQPGSRVYRTGDLARYRPDGNIEFLGRLDHQVKVRGYRIELGAVETALRRHPNIRETVVMARQDTPGDSMLVAYVEPMHEASLTDMDLREHLRRTLPEYMVPSAFVYLSEFPLTSNGKIDRKALPPPAHGRDGFQSAYVAPRTPLEKTLAEIWSAVLNLDRIGMHDNFFEFGGHSLLATRLISRIRHALELELPLRVLFESPTVAGLAVAIQPLLGSDPAVRGPMPRRDLADESAPLSFEQQRLWFLDQWEPGNPAYNVAEAVRLHGSLQVPALVSGLNNIVQRHDALRTVFVVIDGEPRQVIMPAVTLNVPLVDLTDLPHAEREQALQHHLTQEAQHRFDITQAPLVRAHLFRLATEQHVLLLNMHHIISDAWSLGVLYQELAILYDVHGAGRPATLPSLPIQYTDYAVWQRDRVQGAGLNRQLTYWKHQMAGAQPLQLPIDRPRPPVQTYDGATRSLRIPDAVTTGLNALSGREGVTLFMTLLAAFLVLMHRYTGDKDIVVGIPSANRNRSELEGLIGFFVNILALRTNLADKPRFCDLLPRVRDACLDAFTNQDVPFEKLIQELQPQRDLSRTPLFQVFFNMIREEGMSLRLTGLDVSPQQFENKGSMFDLTLYIFEVQGVLTAAANYNSRLFTEQTIVWLLERWQTLLENIVSNPEASVSEIPMISERERQNSAAFRSAQPAPKVPFRPFAKAEIDQSIPARFFNQVMRYPQNLAIQSRRHKWTYEALNCYADAVAGALLAESGHGEGRVALLMDHDAPMVAAILGVLKAGKTYVPLDPLHPADRLITLLRDADAGMILMDDAHKILARQIADPGCAVLNAETLTTAGVGRAVLSDVASESLAYLLYTSGSTGFPKAVMQSHRNVMHHIRAYTNRLHISSNDRLTMLSTYSFDAAVMDLFGALLNGASVFPMTLRTEIPANLLRWIRDLGITVYHSTPTVYRLLFASLQPEGNFPDMRMVVLGGEETYPEDAALFKKHFNRGCLFINGLGPTESTLALQYVIDHQSEISGTIVPVGYPVEDTEVLLIDSDARSSQLYGEIAIRSPYIAPGYWRQPELTRTAFPSTVDGDNLRFFRTGDLGRLRPDGAIEFLGRKDRQVKLRGIRIEPGEIEAALVRRPDVREAAVICREDVPGERQLIAYLVPQAAQSPDFARLRESLKQSLPAYMIPTAFVMLDELPLTPNGKLDRKALPAPARDDIRPSKAYVAPRNSFEKSLSRIWKEVLGQTRVGIHDDFFELGGHSLLATQVMSRMRSEFGVEVPLRTLFENPSIDKLAAEVGVASGAEGMHYADIKAATRHENLARSTEEQVIPASFAQQRLWFLDQLDPGQAVYIIDYALRITGPLDVTVLEDALNEIIRRHESLRTTIVTRNGEPVQVVAKGLSMRLPVIDISHEPQAVREDRARKLAAAISNQPFDLSRGPLLRLRLIRMGPQDHILAMPIHHIIADGWSLNILQKELAAIYGALRNGETSPLAELPIQYSDFTVWQREQIQGAPLQRQLDYWKQQLKELSPLELPTDRPHAGVLYSRGAQCKKMIPAALARRIAELGARENSTLFMTLLAAFQLLLHRLCGQDDITVGAPVAGRIHPDADGMIGLFVNNLVLRADISGNPSFRELLLRVKETMLEAFAHQEVPYERIVEALQPPREMGRNPLFDVLINFLAGTGNSIDSGGLHYQPFDLETTMARFAITLYISSEDDGRLTLNWVYQADLFDAARIEGMADQFAGLLQQIVDAPTRLIDSYSLVTTDTRPLLPDPSEILFEPMQQPVTSMFLDRVHRAPAKTALCQGNRQWSYQELAVSVQSLTSSLIAWGVRKGDVVGISGARSFGLVAAILALLSAGGVMVTIDPMLPSLRRRKMLETAKVRSLLWIGAQGCDEHIEYQQSGLQTYCLDPDSGRPWDQAGSDNLPMSQESKPNDPAYVFFTSGTSGVPKAVLGCHKGISHFVNWQRKTFTIDPRDRVSQLTSLSFDVLLRDIFLPLTSGATLCLPEENDLSDVPNWLERARITILHTVPTLMQMWLKNVALPKGLPELRWVFIAGEPLTAALVQKWRKAFPDAGRLVNLYGPTETTLVKSYYPVPADPEPGIQPIGRPLPQTQILIMGPGGSLCGVGEPGEIVVRTPYRTLGYLNPGGEARPGFVLNPWREDIQDLVYRTGDRGCYRPDGLLEIMGRLDDQVKIRGVRIEPAEVSAVLAQHPLVDVCTVVSLFDSSRRDERYLAAYVVPAKPDAMDRGTLRRYLEERLPTVMIPATFTFLDSLPVTNSGKVDRKALPLQDSHASEAAMPRTAPRTSLERALAIIWSDILERTDISVHDNFFALGGHSLLAIKAVTRIRAQLRINLPIRRFFETPTISGLASLIKRMQAALTDPNGTGIPRLPRIGGTFHAGAANINRTKK